MPPPVDQTVISRADLLARGYSDHQIRQARERGELRSVLPGLYVRDQPAPPDDPADRHRSALTVVVPRLAGRPVVSHLSAAILHGLPFAHSDWDWLGRPRPGEGTGRRPAGTAGPADPPLHLTRPDAAKSRRGAALRVHSGALDPDEVMELAGLPVTTPERTVVDCALVLPFDHAVLLADAALHRGLVSRPSLTRQLARLFRVPGTRRAAQVVAFADPGSRGPGESVSRVVMSRWGLPAPLLDVAVPGPDGRSLGRAAFGFAGTRVLGVFAPDPAGTPPGGRALSGPALSGRGPSGRGPSGAEPLPHRADWVAAGWRPVVWSWPELRSPEPWIERLRSALAPAEPRS
ncbi:type IV toxin-antitoxin system AbiEi family antitoxin domain-containing protein [Nakamurella sp.]|uniref:type IV toxin-antitoxin system AbiEi family antitoxin domain-containing protein n=1 Tax=Nakamurella sp. TaxID=1869182 RepID=UPI003B3B649E